MQKSARLFRRLLLSAAGLTVALIAAELAIRASTDNPTGQPGYRENLDVLVNIADASIGYVNSSELAVTLHKTDRGYFRNYEMTIHTDANGFRIVPGTSWQTLGSRPVLVVGDSIPFGSGVHDSETFAARLMLDHRIPCINMGVTGYNTEQAWRFFNRVQAAHYNPRAIVLTFCPNDIELIVRRWDSRKKVLRIADSQGKGLPAVLRQSMLLSAVSGVIRPTRHRRPDTGTLHHVAVDGLPDDIFADNVSTRQKNMVQTHILAFRELSKNNASHLVVLLFPRREQYSKAAELTRHRSTQDMIKTWLAENGIDFIDIMEVYPSDQVEECFYDGLHPSVYGHKLVANALATRLAADVKPAGAGGAIP